MLFPPISATLTLSDAGTFMRAAKASAESTDPAANTEEVFIKSLRELI
jgi:hypothetical protein